MLHVKKSSLLRSYTSLPFDIEQPLFSVSGTFLQSSMPHVPEAKLDLSARLLLLDRQLQILIGILDDPTDYTITVMSLVLGVELPNSGQRVNICAAIAFG